MYLQIGYYHAREKHRLAQKPELQLPLTELFLLHTKQSVEFAFCLLGPCADTFHSLTGAERSFILRVPSAKAVCNPFLAIRFQSLTA